MFYEEKLIDGRLYCRGTPDGEWRLVTIDALTRRVLAAEADLERAMENHAADLSAAPEATTRDGVLDEIEKLIGAVEGRHFSAIETATSEDDKRRHEPRQLSLWSCEQPFARSRVKV
jgi:hypothetical protein